MSSTLVIAFFIDRASGNSSPFPEQALSQTFSSICVIAESCVQRVGDQGAVASAALLQALVPALLMNICIVGLNQLYDVEIDRVNKPYLPLASGELSEQQGRWIVGLTGAAASNRKTVWSRCVSCCTTSTSREVTLMGRSFAHLPVSALYINLRNCRASLYTDCVQARWDWPSARRWGRCR